MSDRLLLVFGLSLWASNSLNTFLFTVFVLFVCELISFFWECAIDVIDRKKHRARLAKCVPTDLDLAVHLPKNMVIGGYMDGLRPKNRPDKNK